MFTGLVEDVGQILSVSNNGPDEIVGLQVKVSETIDALVGDSVAVNGCCLTVKRVAQEGVYDFDLGKETVKKTNIANLGPGALVNVERAMLVTQRLGGHIVSGHIDGLARISSFERRSNGWLLQVEVPKGASRYMIEKGSICLDGVSLTINSLEDMNDCCLISLTLIPTTIEKTTFKHLMPGWSLNFEVDLVAKYIERLNLFRQ